MKNLIKNQRGTLLFEIILIVIILALAGFAYWQATQIRTVQENSAKEQKTEKKKESSISIKELGIKMTLPEGLDDLIYYTKADQQETDANGKAYTATYVYFSTKSLLKLDTGCAAAQGPIGAMTKFGSDPSVLSLPNSGAAKKVGSVHVEFSEPQAYCSDIAEAKGLADKQKKLLKQAFETAKPLQ
ncbi:MAG TPA: hypothetical protein VNA68_02880 [Candidatus Dormibacteraeota bacterium]|nr:hypothetical protein [Candidatus Dormibacteraeota bacterium]